MKIATWNLNHRVGLTKFFPQAASAIGSLPVEVLVLTEHFPKDRHEKFGADLANHGFSSQMLSAETGEKANRVLIAAKQPFELDPLPVPAFDQQFPCKCVGRPLSFDGYPASRPSNSLLHAQRPATSLRRMGRSGRGLSYVRQGLKRPA